METFWRMGTGHGAYIKRLCKKYQNVDCFAKAVIDERKKIEMVDVETYELIDTFSSESTAQQFLVVCRALGFLKLTTNGTYKVLTTDYDYERVTDYIFQPSDDLRIRKYRVSRIICCLACINRLDEFEFAKKIKMNKSNTLPVSATFVKEKSQWEKDTMKEPKRIKDFLRMVKEWQLSLG